ncbi:MAG TPA: hypothetical protein VIK00_01235 [Candidatus Limnocylindrales bacterium]
MDEMDNVRRVEEMLESDSPPTEALGETTDYRQVASAWSKAHGLGLEEMVQTLEVAGGIEGQRLVDEIRRDPEAAEAFRDGLKEPLSGEAPTAGDNVGSDHQLGSSAPLEIPRA